MRFREEIRAIFILAKAIFFAFMFMICAITALIMSSDELIVYSLAPFDRAIFVVSLSLSAVMWGKAIMAD